MPIIPSSNKTVVATKLFAKADTTVYQENNKTGWEHRLVSSL